MVSTPDLALWLLTTLVEAFVVCLFSARGLFRKFLFLNFYLLLSVAISVGRYSVLSHFGLASSAYSYFYYFSDAILTVFLFLGISELGVRLVGSEMRWRFALLSAVALVGAAWVSYSVVSLSPARILPTNSLSVSDVSDSGSFGISFVTPFLRHSMPRHALCSPA